MPNGVSLAGKDAFKCVRSAGASGDNLSRPRSSRPVSEGRGESEGARKMVFSTLALAGSQREARTKTSRANMARDSACLLCRVSTNPDSIAYSASHGTSSPAVTEGRAANQKAERGQRDPTGGINNNN